MNWHTANDRTPPSLWTRVLAVLCLCLLVMTSSVQAMHVHPGPLPSAHRTTADTLSQSTGDTDTSCPLCAALHSTLHLGSTTCTGIAHIAAPAVPLTEPLVLGTRWHFALFTRPPPLSL